MKFEIVVDGIQHKTHNDYYCVLMQFEENDKNFWKDKMNYMPKDMEIFVLCKILYGLSPTFRKMIDNEFKQKGEGKLHDNL